MNVSLQRVHSRPWTPALRCLLVVAAWQAPLPFWHNHGTLAAASAEAATWLPGHLWHHHAAVDPLATSATMGWHLHFTFPEAEDDAPGIPDPFQQPLLMTVEIAACDGLDRHEASARDCILAHAFIVAQLPSAHLRLSVLRRRSNFFANFAPELPLPVRLGVLRC